MISDAQRSALRKLAPTLPASYYLAGGIALAARLAHRTSLDLDLFSTDDPGELEQQLDRLPGIEVTGRAAGTLYLAVDGVPVSLIQYRYPLVAPTSTVEDIAVAVASVDDLASMKLSAIAGRGAARDFWDLHALIESTGRPLEDFLAVFRRKYPSQDVGHLLRALVYFGDAESAPMPRGLAADHWARIKRDFERWVPALVIA